ncbi:SIMPL domain-containing protein [Algoriphagus namhaensis]|uniref:SIMPL domain-containing protein n=1 Tax=Algoriphagus namhaensis TaxID=915353 RepID=A0ABV8ARJ0_9BACT
MKYLLTLTFLLSSIVAFAQDDMSIPLIEVEGYSERKMAPDQAVFTIVLEEKSMKVSEAVDILNQKTKNLANGLKKNKIKDYQLIADSYSVDLNRIYRSGQSRDSGYVARQTLRIVTGSKNEDLQKIVETIQNSGDMSFNLHFQISEETRNSLENALLTEALKDSESKAQLIATTLGIRSIRVHRVTLEQSSPPQIKMRVASMMSDASPEMMIAPDDQKITKRVLVKYTY